MDISYSKQPHIALKIIFTFFCWEAISVQHLFRKLVMQRGTDWSSAVSAGQNEA